MSKSDPILKKLQFIELAMLKETIRICEKHNLHYFLLGGSALGAVRHMGFIPWDDDIDIGMPRLDYDKFVSLAQAELSPNLFLQTHETDPDYPLPFAKIRNSNTTFIQKIFSNISMNHGVFIDIFPLDGYPNNKFVGVITVMIFKTYRAAILRKLGVTYNMFFLNYLVSVLFSTFLTVSHIRMLIDRLMRKYKYEESSHVINWSGAWGFKEIMLKEYFADGLKVDFSGIPVVIPTEYDSFLKTLYGDYMSLPPVNMRISHHATDIVDLENSYIIHIRRK